MRFCVNRGRSAAPFVVNVFAYSFLSWFKARNAGWKRGCTLLGFAFRGRFSRQISGLKIGVAIGGNRVRKIISPLTHYATCRRRVASRRALHRARDCCCERVAAARARFHVAQVAL